MNEEKQKKINLESFAGIYFLLFFISVIFNEEKPYLKFPKLGENFGRVVGVDIIIGASVGLGVVVVTWFVSRYTKLFDEMTKSFKSILGELKGTDIFFIAAFSSISEEFFFRGFIQGKLGILFASLLFGALHTGPGRKYIPWTIFAVAMGFVLGGLYEWKDDLLLPVTTHFVINFANLHLLQKKKIEDISLTKGY